ncbi:histidine phosphatase family protein [Sporosarcina sp. OR05]|uniref:histidine phosphatase family protein n=1 Tax=Sporosarcina sp. OR05 TaxID=2969819 RepID=UPI00352A9353
MARPHTLYLMRHLPTAGNRAKKYIGWTDEPIEPITEPETFRLSSMQQNIVYGSDLRRARQSANIFLPHAIFHEDRRFRECHFGDFEGKTYADLEQDKDYRNWLDNPVLHAPKGGEGLKDVEKRLMAALHELPNDSLVVTHGGPIRIALNQFSPEPADFWSWQIPHGSLWKFEWANETTMKEGGRCTSLSEVPTTANAHTSSNSSPTRHTNG